ncbi:MAG: hypothetical protein ACOYM7_12370, partial [Paludibacter sp.]
MEEKKFSCKTENLPVIGSFLLLSFASDKPRFIAYSPVFNDPFEADFKAKQLVCAGMLTANEVVKLQKEVTVNIEKKLRELRVLLNPLEGYIKMAKGLDIQASDFGLKQVREGISGKNPELAISGLKSLATSLTRNKTALEAVGYKAASINEITAFITEITDLNEQQNVLKNKRSRTLDEIIKESNALWETMNTVLNAA